jgi:hypothetical protein
MEDLSEMLAKTSDDFRLFNSISPCDADRFCNDCKDAIPLGGEHLIDECNGRRRRYCITCAVNRIRKQYRITETI